MLLVKKIICNNSAAAYFRSILDIIHDIDQPSKDGLAEAIRQWLEGVATLPFRGMPSIEIREALGIPCSETLKSIGVHPLASIASVLAERLHLDLEGDPSLEKAIALDEVCMEEIAGILLA